MLLYEKKLLKFMWDYCFGENINRDVYTEDITTINISDMDIKKYITGYEYISSGEVKSKYNSGKPKIVKSGYWNYTLSQTGLVLISEYFNSNTYQEGASIYLYDSKTKKLIKSIDYGDGIDYTETTFEYDKDSVKIIVRKYEEFDYDYTRD